MSGREESQDSNATQDDIILLEDEIEDLDPAVSSDWRQVGLSLEEIENTLGFDLPKQTSRNVLIPLSEAVSSILAYHSACGSASNAPGHPALERLPFDDTELQSIGDALTAVIATFDELHHAGLSVPAVMTRTLSPEEANVMERVTPIRTSDKWLSTLPNLDTNTASAAITLLYLLHEVAPAQQTGSHTNHLREEMRYTDMLSQFLATRPDLYELPLVHLVQITVMLSSTHQRIKHFTGKAPHQPALSWSLDALNRILESPKDTELLLAHHADILPWLFEEIANTTDPTNLCKSILLKVLIRAAPRDWQKSMIFENAQDVSVDKPDLSTILNNPELFGTILEESFVDSISTSLQAGCASDELEAICYAFISFASKCPLKQKTISELVKKVLEIIFSVLAEAATSLAALSPALSPLLQVLWHAPSPIVQASGGKLDLKQMAPKLAFQITTDTQALRTKESNAQASRLEDAIYLTIAVLQILCRSSDVVSQILKTHHTISHNLASIVLMQLEQDEWNEDLILSATKLLSQININTRANKVDEVLLGLLTSAPYFHSHEDLYYVIAQLFNTNVSALCSENASSAIFVVEHLRTKYLQLHESLRWRPIVLEAGLSALNLFLQEASQDQTSPLTVKLHHVLLDSDSSKSTASLQAAKQSLSKVLQKAFTKLQNLGKPQ